MENKAFRRHVLTPPTARNDGANRPLPAAFGPLPPPVVAPVETREHPCPETDALARCDNTTRTTEEHRADAAR